MIMAEMFVDPCATNCAAAPPNVDSFRALGSDLGLGLTWTDPVPGGVNTYQVSVDGVPSDAVVITHPPPQDLQEVFIPGVKVFGEMQPIDAAIHDYCVVVRRESADLYPGTQPRGIVQQAAPQVPLGESTPRCLTGRTRVQGG